MSKHAETNDFHLIQRTQDGETEAFSSLVRRYHDRLLRHTTRRVENTEMAKDLTQETWLKAFRAVHTFRGDSTFTSWLYRIAENACIDYFRKQKKADAIEPLHIVAERCITDTYPSPCQDIVNQELREHLRAAIEQLTPIRKQVFRLYYFHAFPIKNIAARLKKSEGTIKSHLRNARLQLQEYLTPYLNNENLPSSN